MRTARTLLLAALLAATPHAIASPAQGANPSSDVWATRALPLSKDVVYNHLLDLRNHEKLWAEDCVKGWSHGEVSIGPGASAQLIYVPSFMRRKLTATIAKAETDRYIDLDHAGNKGFVTRWKLTEEGDQTRVDVHTYINAPPKPFVRLYFEVVRPAWQLCHQQALATLERRLAP